MEALQIVLGLLGGSTSVNGRWYVVEARLPYAGPLDVSCRSKLSFRIIEAQIADQSFELQRTLLHSYMEITRTPPGDPRDLRLEKALLPAVCSVADGYPEIEIARGRHVTIRIRKTAGWTIPEIVVDETFAMLTRALRALALALQEIDGSPPGDDVPRSPDDAPQSASPEVGLAKADTPYPLRSGLPSMRR